MTIKSNEFGRKTVAGFIAPKTIKSNKFGRKTVAGFTAPKMTKSNEFMWKTVAGFTAPMTTKSNELVWKTVAGFTFPMMTKSNKFMWNTTIDDVNESAHVSDNDRDCADSKDQGFGEEVENLITENYEFLATLSSWPRSQHCQGQPHHEGQLRT